MFDLHVHAAPDVSPRLADDLQIVRWYAESGYSGCVLKAHYDGTVGRAAAAGARTGLRIYGGLALNQHVGGLNPAAVAATLAMGGRMIWMPTTDAHTHHAAGLPRLCHQHPQLPRVSYAIPPIDYSTEQPVRQILKLIAEFDAVLATGHLSVAEIAWLLPEARRAGITRLLLTHPTYIVPAMDIDEAAEFTESGAYAEITSIQLLSQPRCDAAQLAALVTAIGYDRIVLTSDAGQPENPPPTETLQRLIDALADQRLDRRALLACASDIPERLATK